MATHALPSSALRSSHIADDATATTRKPSLLRRLYVAMLVSQMRRAQREIDRAFRAGIPPRR